MHEAALAACARDGRLPAGWGAGGRTSRVFGPGSPFQPCGRTRRVHADHSAPHRAHAAARGDHVGDPVSAAHRGAALSAPGAGHPIHPVQPGADRVVAVSDHADHAAGGDPTFTTKRGSRSTRDRSPTSRPWTRALSRCARFCCASRGRRTFSYFSRPRTGRRRARRPTWNSLS